VTRSKCFTPRQGGLDASLEDGGRGDMLSVIPALLSLGHSDARCHLRVYEKASAVKES
jgi:hypothetical protein